jgi:hypothetical protein
VSSRSTRWPRISGLKNSTEPPANIRRDFPASGCGGPAGSDLGCRAGGRSWGSGRDAGDRLGCPQRRDHAGATQYLCTCG